jgi:hypothetical protein
LAPEKYYAAAWRNPAQVGEPIYQVPASAQEQEADGLLEEKFLPVMDL